MVEFIFPSWRPSFSWRKLSPKFSVALPLIVCHLRALRLILLGGMLVERCHLPSFLSTLSPTVQRTRWQKTRCYWLSCCHWSSFCCFASSWLGRVTPHSAESLVRSQMQEWSKHCAHFCSTTPLILPHTCPNTHIISSHLRAVGCSLREPGVGDIMGWCKEDSHLKAL